jgi:hypothetical protein
MARGFQSKTFFEMERTLHHSLVSFGQKEKTSINQRTFSVEVGLIQQGPTETLRIRVAILFRYCYIWSFTIKGTFEVQNY